MCTSLTPTPPTAGATICTGFIADHGEKASLAGGRLGRFVVPREEIPEPLHDRPEAIDRAAHARPSGEHPSAGNTAETTQRSTTLAAALSIPGEPFEFADPLQIRARAMASSIIAREPLRISPGPSPTPPVVEVIIGRLEIRAAGNVPATAKPQKPFAPHVDLATYRARRERSE
jgi:hypothetical protein